jgi:hypothetical protein
MKYQRKTYMRVKVWAMGLTAGILLTLTVTAGIATGQAKKVVLENEPIPKGYRSWSLFVICNHQWLLAENEGKVSSLYAQFNSFGDAIGAEHLAVWFSRRPPIAGRTSAPDIDSNQNAAFCTKMKLLPSKSPYIVVTTTYPDLEAESLKHDVLIELNNLPSADIGNLLTKLSDQLLIQGLRQADFNSEQYWSTWKRSVEAIGAFLAGMIRTVKISINTGPVKLEVEGGPAK